MINKDTMIFGSFAENAGNNGCVLFNSLFAKYNIDAIYKSFSVSNIEYAVSAARTLNFKGFAITMPFKKDVLKYVDEISEEVLEIGSANTILNYDGKLKAYNTDYLAAKAVLEVVKGFYTKDSMFILGEGGYSLAVQYSAKKLGIDFSIINRKNWESIKEIKDSIIFNCTPVTNILVDKSNKFIDCIVDTETGKMLSKIQASYQFELYTGIKINK